MKTKKEIPRLYVINDPTVLRIVPSLAKEIGLNESIMLLQIDFLKSISNTDIKQGRPWTYQSIRQLQDEYFPFWSKDTINRAIASLQKQRLIRCSNFNKAAYDKTRWMSINYGKCRALKSVQVIGNLSQNATRSTQNATRSTQNATTIPETSTERSTDVSAADFIKSPFEQEKKKTKILKTEDKELSTSIYEILDKSKYTIEHSKTLTNKIAVAVRRHGLEALKKAVSSRIQYQASAGRDLYIHHFLADAPAIEWHIARSQTLPTPTKSNLPDFSHIQYDDAPFDEHAMDEFKVTHA